MSEVFTRLLVLERKVAEILAKLKSILQRLAADEQQLAQLAGQVGGGSSGGSAGLTRMWLPSALAAGTFGSPSSVADGIVAVPSGNGYTTTGGVTGKTVWNSDTTGSAAGKACWCQRRADGSFDFIVGDC